MESNADTLVGTELVTPPVVTQEASLNKLAEFIGDVLTQLSQLQSLMAERIREIEALEERSTDLETRCEDLEAFNKAIKLKLRQQRAGTI